MPKLPDVGEIAQDSSLRSYDKDGRLHIVQSHISKACVNPYYGREIPKFQELGLDPDRIYYLLRAPEELRKAAESFARLPILIKHQPINADDHPKELVVGAIGSNVQFNDPYLDADTCYWDATAIAGVETDTIREHSCAYHYTAVMTPGSYEGAHYDGIMTEIRGNHLALVEAGRAGSDVLAADSKLEIPMKMTKLGNALFVALGAVSPKLAQDSALPALVGQATKKTFKKDEVKGKLLAMDSELKADTILDAILALDAEKEEKPAEDEEEDDNPEADAPAEDEEETEEEKKKRLAKDKVAKDKLAKDAEKKLDCAMDSFRKELRDADEARRAVRPVVGDVIAQDSAEGIYEFALDQMKVDHKDVKGVPALKALYALASKPAAAPVHMAMDSAGAVKKFPGAARFVQG